MLEREQHSAACFTTLTYRQEDLALDVEEAKRDHTLYLKKLRERVGRVRYYSVLHAGETTKRLHWHQALFGVHPLEHENPSRRGKACTCAVCSAWALGGVYIGELETESAGYIVGYLTEKDKALYATMSRKPGLGAFSADHIATFYTGRTGAGVLAERGDVVGAVRRGKKLWPLGRYLRGRVRQAAGMEANEPLAARNDRVGLLQASLRTVESRVDREEQRSAHVARAKKLVQISRSKKGVGL